MLRFLLSVLFFVPLGAHALEFKPFFSADVRGGVAGLTDGGGSGTGFGQILAVPALKLDDKDTLTLTGLLSSSAANPVLAEDSFFTQQVIALLRPSWRRALDDQWKAQWRATAMHGLNQESPSEKWLSNPYDFEEYSTGLGLSRDGEAFGGPWNLGLGLDYLHRGYPNYRDLTAAFNGGQNSATKDYDAWKLFAESRHKLSDALAGRLALTGLFKAYTDSYIVNADEAQGTLDLDKDRRRSEQTYTVDLEASLAAWAAASADLGLELQLNGSDQNYFDSGQDQVVKDYYGYRSFSFSSAYHQPLGGPQSGHSVSAGYQLVLRSFTGRLARTSDGTYTGSTETDLENVFSLDGRYALARQWAVVGGGDLHFISSNNLYDLGVRNNFTLYTLNLGLEYQL
jgi:hypothetical protein